MENKLAEMSVSDWPMTPDTLLAHLTKMGIAYDLHHHPAFFTVEEGLAFEKDIPGLHCRNLFLRDRKKNNFLLCLQNATDVDMKKLPPLIGSDRLSFGSADRLWEYLGVKPGSVCAYAIVNDTAQNVKICLDASMMSAPIINFHPLINTMTIGVAPNDLVRFIESCGHIPYIIDLSSAAP
jgi:Ala-tRNA(Pro) deacylase